MRQLLELSKVFPDKFIHKNPTGFGDYIQHSVIRQRLLSVLGAYSQEVKHIIREKITDKQGVEREVVTGVVLALTVEIDGNLVTIEEVGDVEQPFNWKTDGARMKDAVSDAVKRCSMALGVGLHLWSQFDGESEYFLDKQLEKYVETPNEN
jgi:hypothetical protein|tara:strand:- start:73 stop:525 length:453 start_codon:yes stop_codon:yes gene_type:complete